MKIAKIKKTKSEKKKNKITEQITESFNFSRNFTIKSAETFFSTTMHGEPLKSGKIVRSNIRSKSFGFMQFILIDSSSNQVLDWFYVCDYVAAKQKSIFECIYFW